MSTPDQDFASGDLVPSPQDTTRPKNFALPSSNTFSIDVQPDADYERRAKHPRTSLMTCVTEDPKAACSSEEPIPARRRSVGFALNDNDSGMPSYPMSGPYMELDQASSRISSLCSTTSSLEPLGESFEVPTVLSPGPRHSVAGILSLSATKDRTTSVQERAPAILGFEGFRLLGPSPSSSQTPKEATPMKGRLRSKSDTTIDPASRHLFSESSTLCSPRSTYSHFHLHPCDSPSPVFSSARSPLLASARPSSPLIADVKVAKSRLLVTKTHCFYPGDFLAFQSCLLGFQIVFHPCNPKARIKHSEITLSMFPGPDDPEGENPVIKAIYPTQGILHKTGESSTVHRRRENSVGLALGIDPYGKIALRHTRSRSQDETSSQYLLGSGIETNTLLLTMTEDPVAHAGVLPSLDFAVLVYLPSPKTQAFEARLTVKASPGGELGASLRGMWTNPKLWTLKYDGVTELGRRTLEVHPDGSRSVFLVSENQMRTE